MSSSSRSSRRRRRGGGERKKEWRGWGGLRALIAARVFCLMVLI